MTYDQLRVYVCPRCLEGVGDRPRTAWRTKLAERRARDVRDFIRVSPGTRENRNNLINLPNP